jgi:hypothetical protein
MSVYIDIILEEFPKYKIEGNQKILVLGNKEKKMQVMVRIISLLLEKYKKSYTIITRDKEFQYELNKLERSDENLNLYAQFSQILINSCFNDNYMLYIDSQEYSQFDIELMQNHINYKKQLGIFYDDPTQNINSYLDSKIDFDYIFLFDTTYFKNLDNKFAKYRDILHTILGEQTIKQTNSDNSVTEIFSKDIIELIETIDRSNKVNEKIYLVLNVKEKKLMYLQM